MSVQGDLEQAVATLLEANAVGYDNVVQGPMTQPQAEGYERRASVRVLGARGARLAYGQTQWTDTIAITCFWRDSISRATRIDEWETFRAALLADQYLGGAVLGVSDAYLTLEAWGEAKDGAFVVMSAEVEVERVE